MEFREWKFKVKGREHHIETEYFPDEGTVVVALDGELVYDGRPDWQDLAPFTIDDRDAAVFVRNDYGTTVFDLVVSGVSYTTRQPFTPPPLQPRPVKTPAPATDTTELATPSRARRTPAYIPGYGYYEEEPPKRLFDVTEDTPFFGKALGFVVMTFTFSIGRRVLAECAPTSEIELGYFVVMVFVILMMGSITVGLSRLAYFPAIVRFFAGMALIPGAIGVLFVAFSFLAFRIGLTENCWLLELDVYYIVNNLR